MHGRVVLCTLPAPSMYTSIAQSSDRYKASTSSANKRMRDVKCVESGERPWYIHTPIEIKEACDKQTCRYIVSETPTFTSFLLLTEPMCSRTWSKGWHHSSLMRTSTSTTPFSELTPNASLWTPFRQPFRVYMSYCNYLWFKYKLWQMILK